MSLVKYLLRTFWKTIALTTIAGFISGISSTALVAIVGNAAANTEAKTPSLALIFVTFLLLLMLSTFASQALSAILCEKAVCKLRMRLSKQILFTPLKDLEKIGVSGLLAILTDDINSISEALSKFSFLCTNTAIVASCFGYLMWISASTFLLMLLPFTVGITFFMVLTNKGRNYLTLAREEQGKLFAQFEALTVGIKELKMNYQNQRTFMQKDLQKVASASSQYKVAGNIFFSGATTWAIGLIFAAIGLLVFGLPHVLSIDQAIVAKYAFITIYLLAPLDAVMAMIPEFSKAIVALFKLEAVELSKIDSLKPQTIATGKVSWKHIVLKKITSTYYQENSETPFKLGPINLTFRPGELVFIVGGNGSGKSTLVKLLTGLYCPDEGEIYLDDCLIDEKNRQWYREHFSVIFADFYLFNRLMSFKDDSLQPKVKHYLSKLKLDRKVQIRDGLFTTINLSQGQRKRLSLLNAYLEDRPIYVFDEWASDQDPQFKEIFYNQFLPELRDIGKAVLVITHDERYFDVADSIVKLDYGRIVVDK